MILIIHITAFFNLINTDGRDISGEVLTVSISSSKKLRNYNRKLFLCSPQESTKTQPTF